MALKCAIDINLSIMKLLKRHQWKVILSIIGTIIGIIVGQETSKEVSTPQDGPVSQILTVSV